jgi:hypothetical protein
LKGTDADGHQAAGDVLVENLLVLTRCEPVMSGPSAHAIVRQGGRNAANVGNGNCPKTKERQAGLRVNCRLVRNGGGERPRVHYQAAGPRMPDGGEARIAGSAGDRH